MLRDEKWKCFALHSVCTVVWKMDLLRWKEHLQAEARVAVIRHRVFDCSTGENPWRAWQQRARPSTPKLLLLAMQRLPL